MEKNNTYSNTLVSMKYSLGNSTNCYVYIVKIKGYAKRYAFCVKFEKIISFFN